MRCQDPNRPGQRIGGALECVSHDSQRVAKNLATHWGISCNALPWVLRWDPNARCSWGWNAIGGTHWGPVPPCVGAPRSEAPMRWAGAWGPREPGNAFQGAPDALPREPLGPRDPGNAFQGAPSAWPREIETVGKFPMLFWPTPAAGWGRAPGTKRGIKAGSPEGAWSETRNQKL